MPDDNQRQMASRRNILRAAGITGLSLVAGCSGEDGDSGDTNGTTGEDTTTEEISRGGEAVLGVSGGPDNLDPHTMIGPAWSINHGNIYEGLFDYTGDLEMYPRLAKGYEVSDDGTLFTVNLREGIQFHAPVDREMVAEDVVFSYKRMRDDLSTRSFFLGALKEIRAIDDYTVEFKLENPYAAFLPFGLVGWVIPKSDDIKEPGYDWNKKSYGTGPFMLEEFADGSHISLTAFDGYWGTDEEQELPYLDSLSYRIIPEASSRITNLKAGELHQTEVPLGQASSVEGNPDVDLVEGISLRMDYLKFNQGAGAPFDDPNFRRAVAWCIDREEIINGSYFGRATPIRSMENPSGAFADKINVKEEYVRSRDVDQAKELLDKSTYEGEELTLSTLASEKSWADGATIIKEQLKSAGIKVSIELVSGGFYERTLFKPLDYEMAISGWGGSTDPDYQFYTGLHSLNDVNWEGESYEEYSDLVEKAHKVYSLDERAELYDKASDIVARDVPYVCLAWPDSLYARHSNLKGQKFHHVYDSYQMSDDWLQTD